MNTTLITGASSGIGLETARICAANGQHLLLAARRLDRLDALAAELRAAHGITVHTFAADLSKAEDVERLVAHSQEQGLTIDILINNAGFGDWGLFHETDWEKEAQMIDLNVRALTQLTKAFLPGMVARGRGRVMNVASTAAFQPGPLMAVYFATKHYVLAFSEAIANELKGTGVTVTALCPGITESGFVDAAAMKSSRLAKQKMPTSAEVARYGFEAMMKGKTVAVHGTVNRLLSATTGLMPRAWVTAITRRIMDRA